ncbi:MAG: exopolysaccharide biosynthesis protein [Leptolyngbyaceae cyanobacterium MAG.088]|nr:exopolysaccharide biosynthesis protein [Leptolyngbyaceae cyanobacterium MAG.088]
MKNPLLIALRYWKLLVLLNACLFSAVGYLIVTTPRTWTANAELILPDTTSNLDANLGTLGRLSSGDGLVVSQHLNPLNSLSAVLLSNDTMRRVWEVDPEQNEFPQLQAYKSIYKLTPQNESTIVSLSADGSSTTLAEQRLTVLVDILQQRLNELRANDAKQRTKFMETKVAQARQTLDTARVKLTQFQQSSNLVSNLDQTQALINTINELTTSQSRLLAESRASKAQVKSLSSRLNLSPDEAVGSLGLGDNRNYRFNQQQLSQVEVELAAKRTVLTDTNPQIQSLIQQRNELRRRVEQEIGQAASLGRSSGENSTDLIQQLVLAESKSEALEQQANALKGLIERQQSLLETLPAKQDQLQELQRQYEIAEGVYKGLIAQVEQTNLTAFSVYPNVQVLDTPSADPRPTGPKIRLMVLGALLSSLCGSLAIILCLERLNPLLDNGDLEATSVPVLKSIPYFEDLAYGIDERFETAIEFQRLASAVSMLSLDKDRLLISSSSMGEGKTTITLGLAVALTSLGFRVLIVDGDWQRKELSNRLENWGSRQSKVAGLPSQIYPNLDFLPLEPPDNRPSEYLASGTFVHHLSEAQTGGNYDYVLVDSPPVSLTSETILMAKFIPQILLVVWPGITQRDTFKDCLEQLTEIVSVVVNGVETPIKSYRYRLMSGLAKILHGDSPTSLLSEYRPDLPESSS